jgi:hypothetical protein
MHFTVFGPFELSRNSKGQIIKSKEAKKALIESVDHSKTDLMYYTGCYVFVLNNGGGAKAWYVGKAEKQSFLTEIFTPDKILKFNEVLSEHKGAPQMYFVPRLSPTGKLCKPGKMTRRSVAYLEKMLIGMAIARNPNLKNLKDVKLSKEMTLPGIIKGTAKGHPGTPAIQLKKVLGLK